MHVCIHITHHSRAPSPAHVCGWFPSRPHPNGAGGSTQGRNGTSLPKTCAKPKLKSNSVLVI